MSDDKLGAAQGWPKAINVKRGEDHWHADVSFARYPTDDELKNLHEFLRVNFAPPQDALSMLRQYAKDLQRNASGGDDVTVSMIEMGRSVGANIEKMLDGVPAAGAVSSDPLSGLDERLDRLLVTATGGESFVISTESANNIVGIVREWIKPRSPAGTERLLQYAKDLQRNSCGGDFSPEVLETMRSIGANIEEMLGERQ